MNLEEFGALKVGDVITNNMTNGRGEIVDVDKSGVRVKWGEAGQVDKPGPTWHYHVRSTAWFHWSKNDETRIPAQPDNATDTSAPTT